MFPVYISGNFASRRGERLLHLCYMYMYVKRVYCKRTKSNLLMNKELNRFTSFLYLIIQDVKECDTYPDYALIDSFTLASNSCKF